MLEQQIHTNFLVILVDMVVVQEDVSNVSPILGKMIVLLVVH
jgi:hypothetical protein